MLKITTIKDDQRCRLVLEGEIVSPWVAELQKEWKEVRVSAADLKLIVDLRSVITISREGQHVLLDMMSNGVRFVCCGVLNRYLIQQLARRKAL